MGRYCCSRQEVRKSVVVLFVCVRESLKEDDGFERLNAVVVEGLSLCLWFAVGPTESVMVGGARKGGNGLFLVGVNQPTVAFLPVRLECCHAVL